MSKSMLSNCYTPTWTAPDVSSPEERRTNLAENRTNGDAEPRAKDALRRLCVETSILREADGSSLVELGHTKVLCTITLSADGNLAQMDTGVLQVRVDFVPYIGVAPKATVLPLDGGDNRSNRQTTTVQQVELEDRIHSALLPSLMKLEAYPKLVIQIGLTVLQNDGSLLTACILASTLGLSDAQIELCDLVTCSEVVVFPDNTILADPNFEEEESSSAKLTVAMMPNWKELTLWQQSGPAPPQAISLCRDGCKTLQKIARQYLIDKASS